ncbi:phage portal protein [Marinomonas sp.]
MTTTDKPRQRIASEYTSSAVKTGELMPESPTKSKTHAFSFGDPEPVLGSQISDYLGIFSDTNGLWYLPPVSLAGLAKTMYANGTHASVLEFKQNQLLASFKDNPMISRKEIRLAFKDFEVFDNAYFLAIRNHLGGINRYVRLPAVNVRVGTDSNFFLLNSDGSFQEYYGTEIIHLNGGDIRQSIYGVPTYFSGIHSILLGEAATLFRRKYYLNGAHSGYILVTFDLDDEKAEDIEQAITQSKGPGNHRSLYMNMESTISGKPGYTKDRVQLIPVGDFGNRDEYDKIKEVTQQDILNMHRVPAGLASIMANNAAGHGDLKNVREVYYDCETIPKQAIWQELNERLPARAKIGFNEPRWLTVQNEGA